MALAGKSGESGACGGGYVDGESTVTGVSCHNYGAGPNIFSPCNSMRVHIESGLGKNNWRSRCAICSF